MQRRDREDIVEISGEGREEGWGGRREESRRTGQRKKRRRRRRSDESDGRRWFMITIDVQRQSTFLTGGF